MVDGLQQHAAGSAGWIVDGLALARIEDIHHETHDGTWGVEFARLLVRGVGKLLDQVFVRLTEHIRLGRRIPQREPGEVFDKIAQQCVRESVFVRPLCIAKNTVKRVRIRLFDAAKGSLERLSDVRGNLANIPPVNGVETTC